MSSQARCRVTAGVTPFASLSEQNFKRRRWSRKQVRPHPSSRNGASDPATIG